MLPRNIRNRTHLLYIPAVLVDIVVVVLFVFNHITRITVRHTAATDAPIIRPTENALQADEKAQQRLLNKVHYISLKTQSY